MAPTLEVLAEFLVVVNLAVINDPDISRFVGKWLMSAPHVDDAEPAHGQADVSLEISSGVIRAAMHHLLIHGFQRIAFYTGRWIKTENATDSTHLSSLPSGSPVQGGPQLVQL